MDEDALGDDALDDMIKMPKSPRPYWVPAGVDFVTLPRELQLAIEGMIAPAYRELVLEAPGPLEQSAGATLVHLMWLEVLDQITLGETWAAGIDSPESEKNRDIRLSKYLRLVGAKNTVSSFLLRLKEFRKKWGILASLRPRMMTDEHTTKGSDDAPSDNGNLESR